VSERVRTCAFRRPREIRRRLWREQPAGQGPEQNPSQPCTATGPVVAVSVPSSPFPSRRRRFRPVVRSKVNQSEAWSTEWLACGMWLCMYLHETDNGRPE